jgi:hypothetical protein
MSDDIDFGASVFLVAVPDDAVDELVDAGLAEKVPALRGPVLDAIVNIGVDSSALVTLMQAPDVLRAFAAWVTGRARKQRDGITITGQLNGCEFRIEVRYDGSVPDRSAPVKAVAELLSAIIRDAPKSVDPDVKRQ